MTLPMVTGTALLASHNICSNAAYSSLFRLRGFAACSRSAASFLIASSSASCSFESGPATVMTSSNLSNTTLLGYFDPINVIFDKTTTKNSGRNNQYLKQLVTARDQLNGIAQHRYLFVEVGPSEAPLARSPMTQAPNHTTYTTFGWGN